MVPHLVRWDEKWREAGLRVIDINNGIPDTQAAVEKDIKAKKKPYPVLWDKDGKNCAAYEVKGFPAAYLLDVDGKVVWEGFPYEGVLPAIEKEIEKQLKRVKKPEKGKGKDDGKDDGKDAGKGGGEAESQPR